KASLWSSGDQLGDGSSGRSGAGAVQRSSPSSLNTTREGGRDPGTPCSGGNAEAQVAIRFPPGETEPDGRNQCVGGVVPPPGVTPPAAEMSRRPPVARSIPSRLSQPLSLMARS